MPRPKVERHARSVRLRAEVDAVLVREATARGVSVNEAMELAVLAWAGLPDPPAGPEARARRPAEPKPAPRARRARQAIPAPAAEPRAVVGRRPAGCRHARTENLGYLTRCADCGTRVR